MDILAHPCQSDSESEPEYHGEHWEQNSELDSEPEYLREHSEMDSEMESEYSEEFSEGGLFMEWRWYPVRYIDKPYNRHRPSKYSSAYEMASTPIDIVTGSSKS